MYYFKVGRYFFTCDETLTDGENLYLIEAKHSARARFPSKNDIKDGLVKLMVYTNLSNVKVGKIAYNPRVVIRLTSNKLKGSIKSDASGELIEKFFAENNFALKATTFFVAFTSIFIKPSPYENLLADSGVLPLRRSCAIYHTDIRIAIQSFQI